ncbi:MAG: 50S ribosomal protein L4 [bacterium]|nr:50S ribosomal protein L4 [bacterium]
MMKLDILNTNGEKVKDLTLNKEIFGIEPNDKVLKDAIIVAQSSLRQGTAKTKNRSEVSGGGRKPWKQKGTGRARQGSIRAVQWVGGGIAFGPTPRSYSKKQNRKERRLALKSAWSYKASENAIVVVDAIKLETPKTKEMLKVLNNLKLNDTKTLVVVKEYDENLILASRNLQNIVVVLPSEISVLDLASTNKVLIESAALEEIKEALK